MQTREAIEGFLLRYKPATQRSYGKALHRFEAYIGPECSVRTITEQDVGRWVQNMRTQNVKYANHPKRPAEYAPLSPWTVYRRIKTVKIFFNWLVKNGVLERSPAVFLPNPRPTDTADGKAAHEDDVEALLAAARAAGVRDYAIVLLLARSGCRRADVSNLRLQDLELSACRAYVWGKGDVRVVRYFDEETARAIAAWLRVRPASETDRVFVTSKGRPLTPQAVYQVLKRRSRDAGLPHTINPHSLRHAVGTRLHRAGFSLLEIQKYLGHRSWRTTTVYISVAPERMREAAAKLGRERENRI